MKTDDLYGLVLAGGRSRRMGKDKGLLNYFGQPQRARAYAHLSAVCGHSFYACRPDQQNEFVGTKYLVDLLTDAGPFAALYTAFQAYPEVAWLILACDYPLVEIATLRHLVQHRDPGENATCFFNPVKEIAEPLMCIYEPAAGQMIYESMERGDFCLQTLMRTLRPKVIKAPDPLQLQNVNHPEEHLQMMRKLTR